MSTNNKELLATELVWQGKDGVTRKMTVGSMLEDVARVCDNWPEGIDELEASQASLSAEVRRFKQIAGKMYCRND